VLHLLVTPVLALRNNCPYGPYAQQPYPLDSALVLLPLPLLLL
jgi:hypothetical protein